jgi:hypothetical protein
MFTIIELIQISNLFTIISLQNLKQSGDINNGTIQNPWVRALLEMLIVAQLFKKFLAFYGTKTVIIVLRLASPWSLF